MNTWPKASFNGLRKQTRWRQISDRDEEQTLSSFPSGVPRDQKVAVLAVPPLGTVSMCFCLLRVTQRDHFVTPVFGAEARCTFKNISSRACFTSSLSV